MCTGKEQRGKGRGWGGGGRERGTLTDDAHCLAESGEDGKLEQDGTACVSLLLTAPHWQLPPRGQLLWKFRERQRAGGGRGEWGRGALCGTAAQEVK